MAVTLVDSGYFTPPTSGSESFATQPGPGVFVARVLLGEMESGDETELAVGVGPRVQSVSFTGAQGNVAHEFVAVVAESETFWLTVTQSVGTLRGYDWKIYQVA